MSDFGAYSTQINSSANKYGIDPSLVVAVAKQESDLGSASQNVMQVNGMDNSDPSSSIDTGTKMLSSYMKQTGNNIPWSLAMYNMGPGILSWAQSQGISDPKQAMAAFSEFQQQQNGYSGYGDPNYIDHVMRYYGG